MRKHILFYLTLGFAATHALVFAQQDNKPAAVPTHYYHLSYAVQEVAENGKITNSRTYTTNLKTNTGILNQIRVGDKVPRCTDSPSRCEDPAIRPSWSYTDFGVSIDSRNAEELNGKFSLNVTADISDAKLGDDKASNRLINKDGVASNERSGPLIIRQDRWSGDVLVPIAKPTVIFSSDDLNSQGKIQIELTATRIE